MIDEPQIVQSDQKAAAVIHLVIPRSEMMKEFGPAVHELIAVMEAQGSAPSGPVFAHHFKITPETFDFEVGFPVKKPVRESGRVKPGELPAAKVVRTEYRGPYEGLPAAWKEFSSWVKSNDLNPRSDIWEVYVAGPESGPDPSSYRTELNWPLAS
jgi:effector-binding domain-containing protein